MSQRPLPGPPRLRLPPAYDPAQHWDPAAPQFSPLPAPEEFRYDPDAPPVYLFDPPRIPPSNIIAEHSSRADQLAAYHAAAEAEEAAAAADAAEASRRRALQWSNGRVRYIEHDAPPRGETRSFSEELPLPSTPQSEAMIAAAWALQGVKMHLARMGSAMRAPGVISNTIRQFIDSAISARGNYTFTEVLVAFRAEAAKLLEAFEQNAAPERIAARDAQFFNFKRRCASDGPRFSNAGPAGEDAYGEYLDASSQRTIPLAASLRGIQCKYDGTKTVGWDYDRKTLALLKCLLPAVDAMLNAPAATAASAAAAPTAAPHGGAPSTARRAYF